MILASWPLQRAVYDALTADAALLALLGDAHVYDDPPHRREGAPFPRITLGDGRIADASSDGADASEHRFDVHVWSRAGGRGEAKRILDRVVASLHDQPLSLDGAHLANLRFEEALIEREKDGETAHARARFRALVEPN